MEHKEEHKEEAKSNRSTYFLISSLLIIIVALVMILLNRFHPNDNSPKRRAYAPMIAHGKTMSSAMVQQQLVNHLLLLNQHLKAQAIEMQGNRILNPNAMNDIAHMAQDQLLDMMQHLDGIIDDHARHQQRLWHAIPVHESEEDFHA